MSEKAKANNPMEPGRVQRPQISQKTVISVIENLYGFSVEKIRELNSYDDRNYHVMVNNDFNNLYIVDTLWSHGFVFKVLNATERQKDHVEAEHEVARILSEKGFDSPIPVLNVHGKESSLEKFYLEADQIGSTDVVSDDSRPFKIHLVRLLKFIPGKIFHQVPYTPRLLYQLGEYLAKFHNATQGYTHRSFSEFKSLWSMEYFPQIRQFSSAVKEEKYKKIVAQVFDAFEEEVIPNYKLYQRGFIHGDFNEQNIIVRERNSNFLEADDSQHDVYDVCGVIDFGECLDSYHLFDVGIAIAHFSVHGTLVDPLLVPGHILAGYLSQRELNEAEFDALRVVMAARYTATLVMGAYTYQQDPGNTYVLSMDEQGWRQLEKLWLTPETELRYKWKEVIQKYQSFESNNQ